LKATGFSGDSAKTFLNELTALGVRQVGTDGENKAADYLESKYRSFGYTQIERQSFPFPLRSQQGGNGTGHNLIVTRPGSKPDAPILVFGSHYDTVANTVGASDNGSGTVTTLELGRVLFKRFPDYELRFISFSGEEIGLIGSFYYASKLSPAEKKRVIAFLDIDAVGVGDRLVAVGTPELVNQAVDIAGQNGIRLEPFSLAGTGADSDQTSFIRTGLKAILIARWIDPQLHRPGDIPQRVFPEALLQAGGISILLAQKLTGSQ
jgi:aminopeptidase YwaD